MNNRLTPEQLELIEICASNEYRDAQFKGEAGIVAIMPLMFTHAIISEVNRYGYVGRWCYSSYQKARNALDSWDGTGDPLGWHRHPATGRRYDNPEGYQIGLEPTEINF